MLPQNSLRAAAAAAFFLVSACKDPETHAEYVEMEYNGEPHFSGFIDFTHTRWPASRKNKEYIVKFFGEKQPDTFKIKDGFNLKTIVRDSIHKSLLNERDHKIIRRPLQRDGTLVAPAPQKINKIDIINDPAL